MTTAPTHVVYDVETVGLLGPVWAIAWVALDATGEELSHGVAWADPAHIARDAGMSAEEAAPCLLFAETARAALAAECAPLPSGADVLRALWDVWARHALEGGEAVPAQIRVRDRTGVRDFVPAETT